MIPIRDHNPTERTPYVTYALIAVNVVVFLSYFQLQGRALAAFYGEWAMTPALVTQGAESYTLLTSMFLHADLLHLGGNMLFLFIFGDNLEEFFGHVGFVILYLLGGLAAAALQIAADPGSQIPNVGASGAIAAIMGGYLLLFPRAKVDVLIPIAFVPWIVSIPAIWVLLFWFALQVFGGFASPIDQGGVAYWAHTGGFIAGAAMVGVMMLAGRRPQRVDGHPDHPPARYGRAAQRRRGPWG